MIFEPPFSTFKGVQPDTPWVMRFRTSLSELETQPAPTAAEALENSLREWEETSAALAADTNFDSREQYCLQQSWLWNIYETAQRRQLEEAAHRIIYNRACKVLEHTPPPGRPADLSFREGDDLIQKMLEHLHSVAMFYQGILPGPGRQRGAQMIPPSTGFHCTNVLEATDNPAQAEGLLQVFLQDNQYVRTILLGDDAGAGATIVDNRLNIPGGGVKPGRGLWVKSYTLLRPKISTWLATALPHDYDQVRCIFMSPKGKPVSFLTKSVPLDQASVSDAILEANDADDAG